MGKPEVDIVFLSHVLPPYLWRKGLPLNVKDPSACIQVYGDMLPCWAFIVRCWEMDSGPLTCIARTSLIAVFTALCVVVK